MEELSTDDVLNELEIFVQKMREEGENDLRTIIHVIRKIRHNTDYALILNNPEE